MARIGGQVREYAPAALFLVVLLAIWEWTVRARDVADYLMRKSVV